MAAFQLNQVSYTYPGQSDPALDQIDFAPDPGQFTVVSGPSQSGKTTLCYLAAGLIPRVLKGRLEGKVQGLSDGATSGLMLQNPHAQLSGMAFSVEEELAMPLENLGVDPALMDDKIQAAMALTGIKDLSGRDPAGLSGGQVQRLVLASVLVTDPDVLILDEPASQMDPMGKEAVYTLARDLACAGKTIIMADKDLERAARFAHSLVVMDTSKIVMAGPARKTAASAGIPEHGLEPPRFTATARLAQETGLWPASLALPATLEQTLDGLNVQNSNPS